MTKYVTIIAILLAGCKSQEAHKPLYVDWNYPKDSITLSYKGHIIPTIINWKEEYGVFIGDSIEVFPDGGTIIHIGCRDTILNGYETHIDAIILENLRN